MSQSTITWRRIGPGHYVGIGNIPIPEELGGGRMAYRIDRYHDWEDRSNHWIITVLDSEWLVKPVPPHTIGVGPDVYLLDAPRSSGLRRYTYHRTLNAAKARCELHEVDPDFDYQDEWFPEK